ncbi:MAG TPA: hypothetical protein VLA49_19635 [Anaerolineales bacterium]|nr:hypothetical protein [Anaerolineales bacterium]
MLYADRLDILLDGYPEDIPDMYRLACPTIHVHPGYPPTLSLRGDRDYLNPKEGNQELYAKLVESGAPTIDVVLPWTEHGFDLAFPQVNPAAQSALYDVDRFLAVQLNRDRKRGLFSACGVKELVENQAIFKKQGSKESIFCCL